MKSKSIYIYGGVFLLVVLFLIIFTYNSDSDSKTAAKNNMPNDEVHNNLNPSAGGMGMGSVSGTAKKKLEDLRVTYESNPADTSKAKEYADMLNAAHQAQKALEIYETILKIDPNRVDILLGSTFSFYNLNDLEKAEEYTKKVLAIDKNNHEANYNMGAIAAAKGNTEKAREHWNNVIKQFPNSRAAKIAENSIKKL
jgi:tetratricopeptide (TPR) repeat protein